MTTLDLLRQDLVRFADYHQAHNKAEYQRYLDFVNSSERCCHRTHLEGHCTGSAFVTSPDHQKVLLLFHPFLQRWLQPGGHADGNPDLLEVARREAHEETGLPLEALQPAIFEGSQRVPFDLDIHPIPARKNEPAHFHYDLRFLLLADPALPLQPESEEMKVEWLALSEVHNRTDEESVLRMVRKLQDGSLG